MLVCSVMVFSSAFQNVVFPFGTYIFALNEGNSKCRGPFSLESVSCCDLLFFCGCGRSLLLPLPVTLLKFRRFVIPLESLEENRSDLELGVLWYSCGVNMYPVDRHGFGFTIHVVYPAFPSGA